MITSKNVRRAIAGSLALAAGVAGMATTNPAAAQLSDPGNGAHVTVPSGSTIGPGEFPIAAADVVVTGDDAQIVATLAAGASDTFTLTFAPDTTSAPFGTGPETFSDTGATADADTALMTLDRTGETCTAETGEFTLSSATYGGTPTEVLSLALRFSVTCSEDTTGPSAEGWVYFNQPLAPLDAAEVNALSEFTSMAPVRLLDTRDSAKLTAGGSVDVVTTANSSGVPTDATAVVVNVTGIAPSVDTFLTAFPKGTTRPTVSNLNPRKDDTVANLATVKTGADDSITVYNELGTIDVVVDIVGFYVPNNAAAGGDRYFPLEPARKLDTRLTTKMAPGETRTLDLGVPADAAVLNVTVTEPTAGGYITVFPANLTEVPLASNINFVSTQTIANQVVVETTAGEVKIYNPAGETHVVVDLMAVFTVDDNVSFGNGGLFLPVDPVRSYDSRNAPGTPIADQETRNINLVELNDRYPFEYGGVVANMTVVDTAAQGFMTAYPRSAAVPFVSNLNWLAGEVRPNLITAGTDEHGFTSFYNEGGSTNLVLDVAGFYTPHATVI